MKVVLLLLVVLPLVSMKPAERAFDLNSALAGIGHILNIDSLKSATQNLLNTLDDDHVKADCIRDCNTDAASIFSVDNVHLASTLCNPMCESFHQLVHAFHIVPVTTQAP